MLKGEGCEERKEGLQGQDWGEKARVQEVGEGGGWKSGDW